MSKPKPIRINLDQLMSAARVEMNVPIPPARNGGGGNKPSLTRQRLTSLKVGESIGISAVSDEEAQAIRKRLWGYCTTMRKCSSHRFATRMIPNPSGRPEVRVWRTV